MQDLFRKRRCAQVVLDGSWNKQASKLNLEELEPFWREMFEKESVIDNSEVDPIGPVMWDMIKPISLDEVTLTINAMKNGSPGLDGSVSACITSQFVAHHWVWPSACCIGETVLISKDKNDISPPKHRPITMANMIIRCFHKLMAAPRMGDSMPLSDRQKAFRSGDGLAENVVLLKSIIKYHTDNNLSLNVVFLDIAKAFDLVSHQSILIAAKRMGIPPPFLTYLSEFYSQSQTHIRVSGRKSDPINMRRAVKQGDQTGRVK